MLLGGHGGAATAGRAVALLQAVLGSLELLQVPRIAWAVLCGYETVY